jgi:hypothetical protein
MVIRFLSKESSMQAKAPLVHTVLCVPGCWKNRTELQSRIQADSQGYTLADQRLTHLETGDTFALEVHAHDGTLGRAFQVAGAHWMTAKDLSAIDSHTKVLYLVTNGGSPSRAASCMAAAAGLLRAGGYAVKVESAGLAHSAETWFRFVEEQQRFRLHRAYVVYVTSEQIYSCGMHNLGYRDAIVAAGQTHDPVGLLKAFTQYLVDKNPTIRQSETFALDADQTEYRLLAESCDLYRGDALFTNPFGMWRLDRL